MEKYRELEGDLIALAKKGEFDVITHGCNCVCTMGAGIAPQMARTFGCDNYPLEELSTQGNIDKLGRIDWKYFPILNIDKSVLKNIVVINSYTQYLPAPWLKPLDYEALALCLRKINHIFKGKHIGLPQIGCGLAGGDWNIVKEIIQTELKDCNTTVVIYNKK